MTFVAGAIAGSALGLFAGAWLQRRAGRSNVVERRGLTIAIALLALLVACAALAASVRDHNHPSATAPVASSTTVTATPSSSTTTTATTAPAGLVTVPDVSHPPRTRTDAVAILKRAHLEVSIETVPLSN